MFKKTKLNLTEGSLFVPMLTFVLPIMITGILQILYNMADNIVVGRFSGDPTALAAEGVNDYKTREKLRALAHVFTVDIYDRLSQNSLKDTVKSTDSTITREYEIDTFLALNFMSNSSREDLAKKLHVSPRQLHRIFKKSYGKSYREKLLEIRLEIALSFITSTDKSLGEISEELGYSNTASFSAFIKNATGKTPREIRKASSDALKA